MSHRRKFPMKRGRDSVTGQFIPIREARRRKATTQVVTLRKRNCD